MQHTIAIASQDEQTISGHAGSCQKFYFYIIENNRILKRDLVETAEEDVLHQVFHTKGPDAHHPLYDADIFLSENIGGGAVSRLAQKKVRAYITPEKDPDTAVKQLIEGTLQVVDMSQGGGGGCGGNGNGGGCGCS